MKKSLLLTGLLVLVGSSLCVVAVLASWWLAERVFFDRFFYYKSVAHGYFVPGQSIHLAQFGQRSLGFRQLNGEEPGQCDLKPRLVLIGDSYLWGMGVRNTETVTTQLSKLLPEVTVVSYAYPGATLADYIGFYEFAQSVSPNNYYIFLAVDNDILADSTTGFGQTAVHDAEQHCEAAYPDQSPVITPNWQQLAYSEAARLTHVATDESWRTPLNLCMAEAMLKNLASSTSSFLITDPYRETAGHYQKYVALLDKARLPVWSIQELIAHQDTSERELQVSQAEIHPSRIAHQMYATVIAQEIKHTNWWKVVARLTVSPSSL